MLLREHPQRSRCKTYGDLLRPAVETNLSTAADDPSAKAKALEAQQEARQKAWEEKARRLSRSICTGC